MKILLNTDKVIIAKSNTMTQAANGIMIENTIYGEKGLIIKEVENEDVEILKYKYIDGKLIPNENYTEPMDERTEILNLKKQLNDTNMAILALMDMQLPK